MADVQLEHGYLKVANRLMEAIIEAQFGGRQLQVIMVLMRLTYGWRRRSVQLTEFELASLCTRMSQGARRASGSFRADLAVLVDNRVVLRAEASTGKRGDMTWAINKDFATWGDYAIAPARLAKWNAKPKLKLIDDASLHHDVARNQATEDDESDNDQWPESRPDHLGEWPESGPPATDEWPDTRPECGLVSGHLCPPKSLNGETYDAGKTRKDSSTPLEQKDHQTVASVVSAEKAPAADDLRLTNSRESTRAASTSDAPSDNAAGTAGNGRASDPESNRHTDTRPRDATDADQVRTYAIALSTATNAAIARRWGEQPNPIRYTTGLELAAELLRDHVPIELARHAIVSVCQASKGAEPPMRVIGYFRGAIVDAFLDAQQRELNAADAGAVRGGPPRPIGVVVNADRERENQALRDRYDAARRAAALEWGKDPAHLAAYTEIVAGVNASYATLPDSPFKERGRAVLVMSKCADAAGFPDFVTWCAHANVGAVSA